VRLSRRLYPGERGHDLDSLIERHGLRCEARHRALPDAAATWQFVRIAAEEHGREVFEVAARQVARQPTLPPHLERSALDAVPDAPGVYLFYDEGGAPLYIGKSRAMRSRVLQHFVATSAWTPRVRRIEWQRTAGELGALLREAELVKELDPVYNRQLRRPGQLCGFAFDGTRLRLVREDEIEAETLPYVYGLWRSRRAALQAMRAAADEHRLCLQALGFDVKKRGSCLRHQLGRCAGVCAGRESIHVHHARVATALARLKNADWPHRGPLGVVEEDASRDATEVHVVDRWCYLGTASCEAEVAELLEARRPRFDYDHYRILSRHLARRGVRVVPLAA
jgi:DNA polymerase-3 subunit epsilon